MSIIVRVDGRLESIFRRKQKDVDGSVTKAAKAAMWMYAEASTDDKIKAMRVIEHIIK